MTTEATVQERLLGALTERDWSVATGESLTAGLVASTMAEVPGASTVLRGGVVAYQPEIKHRLLGIPMQTIEAGLVTAEVAIGLAVGATQALGADVGIGTTGAAGPTSHDGVEPGTVWVAVVVPGRDPRAELVRLTGNRAEVREGTVLAALELAVSAIEEAGNNSAR